MNSAHTRVQATPESLASGHPRQPGDARAVLRKAIADRDKAKAAVARAAKAEQGGRRLRDDADAKLSAFDSLEDQIVAHHAAKFRRAATGGPAPDAGLPDELTARRRARDVARDMLAAAKAALQNLSEGLKAADTELSRAESRVTDAAIEILLAKALAAMPSPMRVWSELWAMIDSWSALSTIVRLPVGMTREIQFFATQDHRQFVGGRNIGKAQALAHWRAALDVLRADPDAEVEALAADNNAASAAEHAA
jgi:hypothetical protein